MSNSTLLIVMGLLSSPGFVWAYGRLFPSKKDRADAGFVNVQGEEKASGIWKQLFDQTKADKEELRAEFTKQIQVMKDDHIQEIQELKQEFARITSVKDEEIVNLKARVLSLESEVAKYKKITSNINTATETIHTAVDVVAEQIKNNIQ